MAEPARIQRAPLPAPGWWVHADAGLALAVGAGLERAKAGDWATGTPIRDFRALVVERAFCMAALAGRLGAATVPGADLVIDPAIRADATPERARAAAVLYRTLEIYRAEVERTGAVVTEEPRDTGALPAVAAVAIAVTAAAAIAFCADRAAVVVDRALQRSDQLRRLARIDATALEAVGSHVAAEAAAGRELLLPAAVRSLLDRLANEGRELTSRLGAPMRSAFPELGSPGASAAVGLGFAAALAAAVWFVFRGH